MKLAGIVMWIILAIIPVLLAVAAIQLGFLPPPHASTVIRIRGGALRIQRGTLLPYAKSQIDDVLREHEISNGFVAITSENRVVFSRSISPEIHQRLRNILLNQ